jgi:osmotically inducible protein OsmC
MIEKQGMAHWSGGLKDGKGRLSLQSGVLKDAPYSFAKRFGDEKGTNPEELIGAAHAACFAMALSGNLAEAGMTAEAIDATSTVTLDMASGAPTVTRVHVVVTAKIPGADPAAFTAAAKKTKTGCPISRLLAGSAEITMEASLA